MSFGKRLAEIRKKQGISQSELAKALGSQAPVIGRYEREEAKPSIEVATKLSLILKVSLDYLVGNTNLEFDKNTLQRMEEISNLPDDKKKYVFDLIDMALRDFKTQRAYAS